LDECLHGLIDGGFGVAGHQQQLLLQTVQFHLKVIFHNFNSISSQISIVIIILILPPPRRIANGIKIKIKITIQPNLPVT